MQCFSISGQCSGAPYGDCWPNHIWSSDTGNYVLWLHGGGTGSGIRDSVLAFSVRIWFYCCQADGFPFFAKTRTVHYIAVILYVIYLHSKQL